MITTYTYSPAIKNGQLSLTPNGDLETDIDLYTQCQICLLAYNVIYDPTQQSEVIPYLDGLPISNLERTKLTTLVKNSQAYLINNNLVQSLSIAITTLGFSGVIIKINMTDQNGNQQRINWSNV